MKTSDLLVRRRSFCVGLLCWLCLDWSSALPVSGQWEGKEQYLQAVEKTFGDPAGMVRLDPKSRVWADKQRQRIVVDGYVALDMGQLEMFACLASTKEHESVVAVFSKAFVVHAGLLAVGAQRGTPVKWEPKYQAPTGSEIQITVLWKDKDGKRQKIDARQWVRKVGTEEGVLDINWVFAGSQFWKDPDTGKERYLAESGDLICVSNFSTATLDLPIESSDVNAGLMFACFEGRVPARGTPVRLILQVVDGKQSDSKNGDKKSADSEEQKPDDAEDPPVKKEPGGASTLEKKGPSTADLPS